MTKKTDWVCLVSGGQDSVTCLYWAKKYLGPNGYALNFLYNQRHSLECDAAKEIANQAGVPYGRYDLNLFTESALLNGTTEATVNDEGYLGLPASVVPGRNLILAVQAATIAFTRKAHHLVMGVCQTDFSGYPDCRQETINAIQKAIQLGMKYPVMIHTPLMYLTKAETIQLGRKVGMPDDVLAQTVTCYNGERPGCGNCPACNLRYKGFNELAETDPALSFEFKGGPGIVGSE